ncbi:dihydrolipoamide acetyltransferase component of pyruvate dehydrogenase complex, putative [Candida dubliniensis CD36]|uniref:Acetyltransferase component of pyruvate dehydrogenase complex n=1 Tax=Candida dubliniensis (strain CD36 / ATCC MYA-646 / CBS 7987 / NCPF 3949 / NRRL Y-17841) TaxID=573826 RepID=B9WK49_CANDC|nr:dihydrolipoamide acetyltransferase component of pyruvate dehydrogenase complex, putative [Candida dubliniensis CD36]CAX40700.1 dihydrolipoamide acetyltransferase component of pyruvate dehydrogenase complex, putative [Candida dubliniensis CD36]
MSALFAVSRSAMALRTIAPRSYTATSSSFLALARLYSSGKFPPHTVINMPALSPTMTQGNIQSWAKKVGDELTPGEAIAEIETDKASMDFEFQEEGYLAKILLDAGAKDVPVGQPIAVYVEDASEVAAFEDFTAADAGEAPKPAPAAAEEAPKKEEPKASTTTQAPASTGAPSSKKAPTDRIIASPFAKTIALEKGISLKGIKGSGPNGRIVAKDLEGVEPQAAAAAPATPAATTGAAPSATASYEDIPITSMRKTIASRLLQSTQQSPSYIIQSQISVSKLLKLRASLNATAEERYKLSINDLLIKAIARTCVRVPEVNAAWLGEQGVIRQYKNVDVSVAVATPTGLITPIVTNAESKGLAEISNQVKDLGKRAKVGKLLPEEFQGGTICISNLGMNHAVTAFTSIINPPQSAILAIGTTEKKAVPSEVNEQGFVFDDVITITGTFDHRVIDGALGGEWMKELKRIVENPLEMLI